MNIFTKFHVKSIAIAGFILLAHVLSGQTFTVDFNKWVDNPLIKKFGVYMTPLAPADQLLKSNELLSELNIPSYRYEFGWGTNSSLEYEQITKEVKKEKYELKYKIDNPGNLVDSLFNDIKSKNIKPFFLQSYTPSCLQPEGGSFKSMVNSLTDWQAINFKYAEHFKNNGFKGSWFEIWNDPDIYNLFFAGNVDDYCNLYKYASLGIREADADAQIGGPAFYGNFEYLTTWLDFVKNNNLPVNYVSYHDYEKYGEKVFKIREELSKRNLSNLPIVLSGWTSFNMEDPNQTSFNCPIEKSTSSVRFFRDVRNFLTIHDLAEIHWSQWRDAMWMIDDAWEGAYDKFGLLTIENARKPLFNAFKLYSWMPVDRFEVSPDTIKSLYAMASRDEHRAAVVIWNTSTIPQTITLNVTNLPFSSGSFEVYRVDNNFGSIRECGNGCENQLLDGAVKSIKTTNQEWSGYIPGEGIIYLSFTDSSEKNLLTPRKLGSSEFVKHLYQFDNRKTSSYAFFDPKTWIARLGSGSDGNSNAIIGSVIDNPETQISIMVKTDGRITLNDNNSVFGIRIDYQSNSGDYTTSVFLHGGIYSAACEVAPTWGTKRKADKNINFSNFNSGEEFLINLSEYAPYDWNKKRVILSFQMKNTGPNNRARFILKMPDDKL